MKQRGMTHADQKGGRKMVKQMFESSRRSDESIVFLGWRAWGLRTIATFCVSGYPGRVGGERSKG